jgi:hypothetical protein
MQIYNNSSIKQDFESMAKAKNYLCLRGVPTLRLLSFGFYPVLCGLSGQNPTDMRHEAEPKGQQGRMIPKIRNKNVNVFFIL